VADPSCLSFSSPDRRLRSSGPPIALGRSLIADGRAIPRPRVARQLRLLICGESRGCEVATLRETPLIASHTGSIAGPRSGNTNSNSSLAPRFADLSVPYSVPHKEEGAGSEARAHQARPTRSVGTGSRNIQRVDAGGLRFRIGNQAVRERGRVPKRLGLHLVVLARHRSRDEGVSEPEVHAGSLGSTEPSEAAGTNIVQPRRRMAQESAGCDFSLRSAGDSRQRASQKGAMWPIGASRNNIWTWSVADCDRQSCWRAVPAVPGTKLISRAEGAKS
jgi:hypothetical protein